MSITDVRVVLPGSEQPDLPVNTRFGSRVSQDPVDPSKQKTVTIYLRRMTPEILSALTVLASENQLLLRSDTPGSCVQMTGRLGNLWDAFADRTPDSAQLYHSIRQNFEYDSRKGSLAVPASLAQLCAEPGQPLAEGDICVLGLDDRPIASPRYSGRNQLPLDIGYLANSAPQALYPHQVARAYGLPANVGDGSGVTVGIISLGGGYKAGNLAAYCQKINCSVPSVEWIPVDGGGNHPGDDADTENALDINVMVSILAYAFGPNHKAKILVAAAPNTDAGFANGIATLVQRGCSNIGCSWGSAESQWAAQARAAMQNIARGTKCRIFPASGDDGDRDGLQGFNVDFLGSMPESFTVGGTRLVLNPDGSRFSESVWGGTPGGGAGGGGLSQIYARPDYQSAYPLTRNGQFWHGVPDFSGNADPASGYLIYQDGLISVGGTSGSAPLYAVCFAVLDYLGIHLDHPTIYAHPEWFFDVTSGNNSPRVVDPRFPAGTGYDVASGLGVLDFSKVIAAHGVIQPPPVTPPPVVPPVQPPPTNTPNPLTSLQRAVKTFSENVGLSTHNPPSTSDAFSVK